MNTLFKSNSILTWIPSHIGIHGNERVEKAAKKHSWQTYPTQKVPYTDLKPIVNKFILKKLWRSWDDQTQNKLHRIQDTIGEWLAGYRRNRKEVIISRLHIGHIHITHSHPKWEDLPHILNMQSTPQSNTFLKLTGLKNSLKTLPDKQLKEPF